MVHIWFFNSISVSVNSFTFQFFVNSIWCDRQSLDMTWYDALQPYTHSTHTFWVLSALWISWHSFNTMPSYSSGTKWQHLLRILAISYTSVQYIIDLQQINRNHNLTVFDYKYLVHIDWFTDNPSNRWPQIIEWHYNMWHHCIFVTRPTCHLHQYMTCSMSMA